MERIVLFRSCHLLNRISSALPKQGDELHVTISVTNGDSISGTPHRDANVSASEPIHEDLLRKVNSGSMSVHKIKIPLCDVSGTIIIEDVATSPLFHATDEISVFCVIVNQGISSLSPLYTAYSKVSALQTTTHPDIQIVQHVGLRVCEESTGVCLTIAKAPNTTDRGIEGALASEHLRCFNEHIVNWQLERALQTKNAAVDELIHSDILLGEELKRQRQTIDRQPIVHTSDDENSQLRARIKELELERVRELETVRKLIAERRAEREAHIEARLKEGKTPVNGRLATGSARGQAGNRLTPLRNVTPQRSAAPSSRIGATTPVRGAVTTPSRNTTSTTGRTPTPTGRAPTPTRGPIVPAPTARTPQRFSTPPRGGPPSSVPSARRTSVATSPSVKSPPSRSVSGAPTPNQGILKRAEDNLLRLRGDTSVHSASGTKMASSVNRSTNGIRTQSPTPGRVPPPPPDLRTASPSRQVAASAAASSRRSTITPSRSSTPTGKTPAGSTSGNGVRSASLMKNNTQSLIRMARQ